MADTFELKIITPERVMYTHPVTSVIFRTTEGEMQVLGGHIPLTAVIDSSVFHFFIENEGGGTEERQLAVHEGFVEILPNRVTLLTESAEWPEEIDPERAERARKRAEERLNRHSPEVDERRAELALRRSLTRLQMVRK